MNRALSVALLILIGVSHSAFADDSTEQMLSACRAISNAPVSEKGVVLPPTFEGGYCWGAFTTLQKNIVNVDAKGKPFYGVCVPPSSTLTQLISIFVAYAQKNPAKLNEDYFYVALSALREAFPCHQ